MPHQIPKLCIHYRLPRLQLAFGCLELRTGVILIGAVHLVMVMVVVMVVLMVMVMVMVVMVMFENADNTDVPSGNIDSLSSYPPPLPHVWTSK